MSEIKQQKVVKLDDMRGRRKNTYITSSGDIVFHTVDLTTEHSFGDRVWKRIDAKGGSSSSTRNKTLFSVSMVPNFETEGSQSYKVECSQKAWHEGDY